MLPLLATLVGASAPLIGSFFSSDKQPIVDAGVKLAATALGCPPDVMSIQNAISADPQAMVKLAEFESRERIAIGQQRVELERIAADDRHSARRLAVDGGQSSKLFFMALFLISACVGMEALVLFYGVHPGVSGEIVGRILGTLDTLAIMVCTFWYGSTAGSQSKDALLYNSTPAAR